MKCLISKNLSMSKFDRFFVFMLFIIDDKILDSRATYYLSCKLLFLSSYFDRFSFSIRANSAALSSFP
jgi:hypothetical protein